MTCELRARSAAALNLATFSRGVSPAGPGVPFFWGLEGEGLAEACGIVDVNRVASVADFVILGVPSGFGTEGGYEEDCWWLYLHLSGLQCQAIFEMILGDC